MTKIGRNSPCPCGSGKKYKRCCLARQAEESQRNRLELHAPSVALDWLFLHHNEAVEAAIEDVFTQFDAATRNDLADLPDGFQRMIDINLHEWLLAEGYLDVGGQPVAVRKLILGKNGPLMEATQRGYLEKLCTASLSLYEVTDVRRGVGLQLLDTLHSAEATPIWVKEVAASASLRVGNILGARLIPGDPATLSGALYPFSGLDHLLLHQGLTAALEYTKDADTARETIGLEMLTTWLRSLTAPPPRIVDAASGDPFLLVRDRYRVRDWDALEAALADRPEVTGDRQAGWTVGEPESKSVDDGNSVFLSLAPGRGDLLEASTRSISQADKGREWLTSTEEFGLDFHIREIADPMSPAVLQGAEGLPSGGAKELSPAAITEICQQMFHRIYANWADEPLPICGGKTPRQAIQDPSGRRQVIELIRTYERNEREQAADGGREPASLEFLWQELGLPRDD